MRINKYLAAATGLSRRAADAAIAAGRVQVNNAAPQPGQAVSKSDDVRLDGQRVQPSAEKQTVMLNKPVGYVVSRDGQGSPTVYDLLPPAMQQLKPVGRLDKDSSGLLLLTNDGQLAQELTHPKYQKTKIYQIQLDRPLLPEALKQLDQGVQLEDGISHLDVRRWTLDDGGSGLPISNIYRVAMHEGKNRQIRRTFAALDYTVTNLHRTAFGDYHLPDSAKPGDIVSISIK